MQRFWDKVEVSAAGGCWEWNANRGRDGYGRFKIDKKTHAAHRVAYELLVGPIPEGLQIDHLCRNKACVNPSHLEPVTAKVNTLRGVGVTAMNAQKTHCIRGHELSGCNLVLRRGERECRECANELRRQRRQRQKEALCA